jgi:hypothetical protein
MNIVLSTSTVKVSTYKMWKKLKNINFFRPHPHCPLCEDSIFHFCRV